MTIEAIEYDGTNLEEIQSWLKEAKVFKSVHGRDTIVVDSPKFYGAAPRGSYVVKFSDGRIRTISWGAFEEIFDAYKERRYYREPSRNFL